MESIKLKFGIEIELYLKPRDPNFNAQCSTNFSLGLREVGAALKNIYNEKKKDPLGQMRLDFKMEGGSTELIAKLREYEEDQKLNDYQKWSITHDPTMELPMNNTFRWPLEFASPILEYDDQNPDSNWRVELSKHFHCLQMFAELDVNNSCGMHVHISPSGLDGKWSLEQVRKVAYSVLYFERAFEVVVTRSRLGNYYSRSNLVDNGLLKFLEIEDCFQWIQRCKTMEELIWLMNPIDYKKDNPPFLGFPTEDMRDVDRFFGWNFENIIPGEQKIPKGTIEFRRAPGVDTAANCTAWTDFAVSFVKAAVKYGDPESLKDYGRDVGGLKAFLKSVTAALMRPDLSLRAVWLEHKLDKSRDPVTYNMTEEKRKGLPHDNDDERRRCIINQKLGGMYNLGLIP